MLVMFLIVIFMGISFVLWCVARASCWYDRVVDDAEQERFVQHTQKT